MSSRNDRIANLIRPVVIGMLAAGTFASGVLSPPKPRYRRELMSWSVPFRVWMPLAQYFSGGYAMHQFASVPAYPASHGCVRVPDVEARTVWQFGAVGVRVWTR